MFAEKLAEVTGALARAIEQRNNWQAEIHRLEGQHALLTQFIQAETPAAEAPDVSPDEIGERPDSL